jgi:hypothetical protein
MTAAGTAAVFTPLSLDDKEEEEMPNYPGLSIVGRELFVTRSSDCERNPSVRLSNEREKETVAPPETRCLAD